MANYLTQKPVALQLRYSVTHSGGTPPCCRETMRVAPLLVTEGQLSRNARAWTLRAGAVWAVS